MDYHSRVAASRRKAAIDDYHSQVQAAKNLQSTVGQSVEKITEQTGKGSAAFGMWGQAFKGAFIGAVAGIAFSTIISGLTGIVSTTKDLIVTSVELAAKFEMTRNAMTLFTGSAAAGRAELSHLADLAKSTPGLRLEDAETGATRLRALGFQAKVVNDLVVGLAKQKLISGVDDVQAMNRVIVNLQQLSAGSPQIERDIRQMVLALPSLSLEINKAFGGVEQFKKALREDSGDALAKFAESLAKAQAPAAGLTDATGKLLDAWTKAGRAFGEPILEPLTRVFKDLTFAVEGNLSMFKSWGTGVANAIQGISVVVKELTPGPPTSPQGAVGREVAQVAAGKTAEVLGLSLIGGPLGVAVGAGYHALGAVGELDPVLSGSAGTAQGLLDAQRAAAFNASARSQQRQDSIVKQLSRSGKETKSDIDVQKSLMSVQLALRESFQRNTLADERRYQQDIASIKMAGIQNEVAILTNGLQKQLDIADGDYAKRTELLTEYNKDILVLNAQQQIARATELKQQSELQKRFQSELRRDMTEFNDLQTRASQQSLRAVEFDIEKRIEVTGTGYDELKSVVDASEKDTTRIIADNVKLRLQDATLTDLQRVNITKQANLDIQDAQEQHRQKLIEIDERKLKQQLEQIRFYTEKASQASTLGADRYGSIASSMQLGKIDKNFVGNLGQMLFGGDIDEQFKVLKNQLDSLKRIYSTTLGSVPDNMKATLAASAPMEALNEQIKTQVDMVHSLDAATSDQTKEIYRAIKAYQEGKSSLEDLQHTQLQAFDNEQTLRVKAMSDRIAGLGDEYGKTAGASAKAAVQLKIDAALEERRQYQSEQSAKRAEFYRGTIAGLTEEFEKLKNADPEILRNLKDAALGTGMTDRDAAMRTMRQQEVILGDKKLTQMARETAYLTQIVALRQQEFEAILRIDKAHLAIDQKLVYSKNQADASVLEFLAQQKGITEIVSDTKINLLTTAYSGLDAVASRLTRSFGAFRDVARDLLANLLKLFANSLFGKLFGGSSGAGGGLTMPNLGGSKGGGFSLGGLFGGNAGGGIFNFGGAGGSAASLGIAADGSTIGSGRLLGAQDVLLGSGGSAMSAGGGILSGMKGMAGILPILGGSIGATLGGSSTAGNILGGIGGALAGGVGMAALLGTSTGIFAAGGSLSFLAPLFTNPFTAVAAGALLVGALLIGKNAKRKKDEVTRNTAMGDAFTAIDKLISDVNADRIDGASAIEQANNIRKQYLDNMSKLKDRKTREIALRDVSRIDSKIDMLKGAVSSQMTRKERLDLLAPTFETGGSVMNPLGYQTGSNMMGYFPSAGTYARFNEAGNEYILDAATTRNVGVENLDALRASQGASFGSMRSRLPVNAYQSGGNVTSGGGSGQMVVELHVQVGLSQEDFVTVIDSAIKNNDGSREQIKTIASGMNNQGPNELTNVLADLLSLRTK